MDERAFNRNFPIGNTDFQFMMGVLDGMRYCFSLPEYKQEVSEQQYCQKIINRANRTINYPDGRSIYLLESQIGRFAVMLYHTKDPGKFENLCGYQIFSNFSLNMPLSFRLVKPSEFCKIFFSEHVTYKVLSFRKCGEPKLQKPDVLKGCEKAGNLVFIPHKCTCDFYVKGSNVYIKHKDYFSPEQFRKEDAGLSLRTRLEKYGIEKSFVRDKIYDDCWGAIVLRQEAWVVFENLLVWTEHFRRIDLINLLLSLIEKYHGFQPFSLDVNWRSMIESLVRQLDKRDRKSYL